jgi:uncharacterized protein (DUF983 family)
MDALRRGLTRRCPACGSRGIFAGYLKTATACPGCALPVGEYRADDAPPYFTIFIVGHVVIPAVLAVEQHWHPPAWLHVALWVPATLLLTLLLLPLVKGAVIGVQWAFGIKG